MKPTSRHAHGGAPGASLCPCGSGKKRLACCARARREELAARGWNGVGSGAWKVAEACAEELLRRHGQDFDGLHLAGVAAFQRRDFPRAVTWLRSAHGVAPDNAGCLNSLGNALRDAGQVEEAIGMFQAALRLAPHLAPAHLNLGIALKLKGELEGAMASYRRALALSPAMSQAHYNLAVACSDLGEHQEAEAAFRQAIRLAPTFAEAHYNLGLELLRQGRWQEGWREYEWRWRCRELPLQPREFPQAHWRGEALPESHTLLLHAEQGVGDTLHFVRYLPMVRLRAPRLVLECPPGVRALLAGSFPELELIPRGHPLPEFQAHLPLLSLPHVLGLDPRRTPVDPPYLRAPEEAVAAWRDRLAALGAGRKMGLAWAGNPEHVNDRRRSIPLARLAPLFELPGIRWVSLQKGAAAEQIGAGGWPLTDWSGEWEDFRDTAALIGALDGVVSVDTGVAHLAGALGKPVGILLPTPADWRWQRGGAESVWYPTARLYRQTAPDGWEEPLARLCQALALGG